MSRWSVVVPTCRSQQFVDFLGHWDRFFVKHHATLIVVQDLPSFDPGITEALKNRHYPTISFCWKNTPDWHPRKADMIRSVGIHHAWRLKTDYTLTLDDDVRPINDPFAAYESVFSSGAVVSDYVSVGALTSSGLQMRGFPYHARAPRDVAVQFGGWSGVLDYDAPTQLATTPGDATFYDVVIPVPKGSAVTTCIMNAAWRTEYAPIMWQLPLLTSSYKTGLYNRFGDIWAGLFAKKVLDFEGKAMVINGAATVQHERASDPLKNLERESPGIPVNEHLWDALEQGDYQTVTESAYRHFLRFDREYADHFRKCRDEWMNLFTEKRSDGLRTGRGRLQDSP